MTYQKKEPKESFVYKIGRSIKERLFGKGDYGLIEKLAKADRSSASTSLLGQYLTSASNRIKQYEIALSEGKLKPHEIERLLNKETKKIKSLERAVEQALAVILILGAIFLFSFSKDPITGYSIYTATSSLNYAVLSGVFLLLSSMFLIVKTHK
jgi:hypothetical protein